MQIDFESLLPFLKALKQQTSSVEDDKTDQPLDPQDQQNAPPAAANANGSPAGGQVIDATPWINAPSRIPQAGPDLKPPNLRFNNPQQQRATLAGLMQGVGSQTPPSFDPGQLQSGDSYSKVSTDWITANEGGSLLNGYVPRARKGTDQSGVTIGAGYDLGQHSAGDLRALNLPDDLIKRLTPYVGLQGQDARDALAKQPLSIGRGEANQIDQGAFDSYLNSAGDAYDQAAGEGAFAKLPWQAQTAISDLWYNMNDLRKRAPDFWRQVTTGDWNGAYQNLQNFTQKDSRLADRARSNSFLVKDAIDHGTLPSQ